MKLYCLSSDPAKPCYVLSYKELLIMLDCGLTISTGKNFFFKFVFNKILSHSISSIKFLATFPGTKLQIRISSELVSTRSPRPSGRRVEGMLRKSIYWFGTRIPHSNGKNCRFLRNWYHLDLELLEYARVAVYYGRDELQRCRLRDRTNVANWKIFLGRTRRVHWSVTQSEYRDEVERHVTYFAGTVVWGAETEEMATHVQHGWCKQKSGTRAFGGIWRENWHLWRVTSDSNKFGLLSWIIKLGNFVGTRENFVYFRLKYTHDASTTH